MNGTSGGIAPSRREFSAAYAVPTTDENEGLQSDIGDAADADEPAVTVRPEPSQRRPEPTLAASDARPMLVWVGLKRRLPPHNNVSVGLLFVVRADNATLTRTRIRVPSGYRR